MGPRGRSRKESRGAICRNESTSPELQHTNRFCPKCGQALGPLGVVRRATNNEREKQGCPEGNLRQNRDPRGRSLPGRPLPVFLAASTSDRLPVLASPSSIRF